MLKNEILLFLTERTVFDEKLGSTKNYVLCIRSAYVKYEWYLTVLNRQTRMKES